MDNQIITVALKEINKVGIKFTISELVKDLSISKSTLYAHFKSKEELIGAIVDLALASLRQQRQNILNDNMLNVPDKLKAVLVARPPMDIGIRFMLDLKRQLPEEWNKFEQQRNEKWETIEFLIRQGIASGYFRSMDATDLIILRMIFDATRHELMNQNFSVKSSLSLVDAMHKIADILCRSILKANADEP